MKGPRYLNKKEAELLSLSVKPNEKGRNKARYYISDEDYDNIVSLRIKPNKRKFVNTQNKLNKNGEVISSLEKLQAKPIDVPDNFEVIKISTSKTTGQQWIQYAPKQVDNVEDFDFESIIKKYIDKNITPIDVNRLSDVEYNKDFDSLTYTDVHIGMDTDADSNTMYESVWNRDVAMDAVKEMIQRTLMEQESNVLFVDELGDFLDGFDGKTTRGGHALPQNMTNEEAFDVALEFKMTLLYGLVGSYEKIVFNNITNDNHSGSFGYFVSEAFKQIAEVQFSNVEVVNHRKFINHYFVGNICFLISHGKDDKSLKFGFKPQLDFKGVDKIDQYCKRNSIYKKADLVIFKKGDSHQMLFDYCTSDDFLYFNYPALSPSSNWVKNNFKLGRRGFVNENFSGLQNYVKPYFM